MSSDGNLLVTDFNGGITVFDATGKQLLPLREPGDFGVEKGVFEPDGSLFVTAGQGRAPPRAT